MNLQTNMWNQDALALLSALRKDEKKAIRELWKANQGAWPEMITHWTAKRNAYRKYRKAVEIILNNQ